MIEKDMCNNNINKNHDVAEFWSVCTNIISSYAILL